MNEEDLVMHRIIVLVPFRNAGQYIIDCLNSILAQQYTNYIIYLLDDASDDGTLDLVDEDLSFIHKIRNENRLGAMENIYKALTTIPMNDEDIVILLDGDDYIFGEYAFQIVNEKYNEDILLTYGRLIDSYGNTYRSHAYSIEEFSNLRSAQWWNPHLKTFKYKLFKALLTQDPDAKNFKNENGKFYEAASDLALMFPLMEISGYDKIAYISNVIYCYRLHSKNVHATINGRQSQLQAEEHIRARIPLKKTF